MLPEAIKLAREAAAGQTGIEPALAEAMDAKRIQCLVRAHFDENDHLNLEGFLRFRMRDTLSAFEMYAVSAAEELMLQTEYLELMRVLSVLVRLQQPAFGRFR